jgi:hypothetical protein
VALTAYQARNAAGSGLIDEPVLNSVIVLMVVTSVLGPVLTERYGRRLIAAARTPAPESTLAEPATAANI